MKFMEKAMLGFGAVLLTANSALAAFELPDLPVSDLETAGAAVAALVAAYVILKWLLE